MGHTVIAPLKSTADPRLVEIYEAYESAWGDYDHADEEENEAYYGGLIDAYYNVLVAFDAFDPEAETEYVPTFPAGTILTTEVGS